MHNKVSDTTEKAPILGLFDLDPSDVRSRGAQEGLNPELVA